MIIHQLQNLIVLEELRGVTPTIPSAQTPPITSQRVNTDAPNSGRATS